MEKVKLVVLLPVGPTCTVGSVQDTLESILFYMTPSRKIILLDDSGGGIGEELLNELPEIDVLRMPGNSGKRLGLYANLVEGFQFALARYEFEILLRLDSDALIIGEGAEEEASQCFRKNPVLGMLGSYRIDCNGEPRDYCWSRDQVYKEIRIRSLLRHPKRVAWALFLRKAFREGLQNGYEPGEHCLGAAVFLNRECVKRFSEYKLPSRKAIAWSLLADDHLMGLFVYTVGLKSGDFATGSLPLGVRWKGLPCSPEELLRRRKKIVHSVHYYQDLSEERIRDFFRLERRRESAFHLSEAGF